MIRKLLMRNYMLRTLFTLKGNGRVCLWAEPLWGIPYNLYMPYVSLYMAAMGLSAAQIGLVTSINIISQVVFSMFSGVVTDKLGRRWTTVIFDTLAWSVPTFIWMLSQNFAWFAAAAVFNGAWRVTETSWDLLLVEDMRDEEIMAALSLAQVLGLLAAFIAPLSKFAVDAFGLVPTMRVLYGVTCTSMTIKFLIVHLYSSETRMGRRRMQETKEKRIFTLLWECKDVYLGQVLSKRMLLTFGILAAYTLVTTLCSAYWALLVCRELHVGESSVALYSTVKSLVTLLCAMLLLHRISRANIRRPILQGVGLYCASLALLLLARPGALLVPVLVVSCAMEAVAVAILSPTTRSLLLVNAKPEERARVCGLIYATIALLTAVFPGLVGMLAEVSLRLPFAVCIALCLLCGVMTDRLSRLPPPQHGI